MSIKDQMLKARELISQKRYDEARAILVKIDHPTARDWLAKLDARAAAGKATSTASKQKPPKAIKAQAASSRRSPLPLVIAGIVLLLITLAGVVLLLPRLNNGANGSSQAAIVPSDETGIASTDAVQAADSDESDNADNAPTPPNDGAEASIFSAEGSGLRVPFPVTGGVVTVDLPINWVCDCSAATGRLHPQEESFSLVLTDIAAFAFDPNYYLDKPLAEALNNQLNEDDTLTSQETITSGGREILVAVVTDEDGDAESQFYAKDGDGHILKMVIPSYVDEHDRLRPAVLFMLGSAEGETGEAAFALTQQLLAGSLAYNAALNRWRVADTLDASKEHSVELPANWVIGAGGFLGLPMAQRTDVPTSTDTAFVVVPSSFHSSSDSVMDILIQFSGGDTVLSQAVLQANGREVAFAVFSQPDTLSGQSSNYLTRDSDGDVVAMIVQPDVEDQAALQADILFMIGNLEAESVDYVVKLQRLGLLPGAAPLADGYEIVPLS